MTTEAVADAIARRRTEGHHCIAPLCPATATCAFLFTRMARVAGRWWHEGDYLDVCAEHARQIYAARDADTYAQLPAWLRPYPEDPVLSAAGRPPAGRWVGLI